MGNAINMDEKYKCPRDGAELDGGTLHDVPVFLCPTCQGLLVKQQQMNALLEVVSKELQRSIPLDCPLERIPDKGADATCPVCDEQMEHYGYMGARFVMVDACRSCCVLWLDARELGAMAVQFARTARRIDVMHMQDNISRLRSARMAEAMDLANVVGRWLLVSFVVS
jgi:Zn-finger nucleic acid-binding protein